MAVPVTPRRSCVYAVLCVLCSMSSGGGDGGGTQRRGGGGTGTRQTNRYPVKSPSQPPQPCLPALIKLHLPARGAADAIDGETTACWDARRRSLRDRRARRLRVTAAPLFPRRIYRDGMIPLDTARSRPPKNTTENSDGAMIIPPGNGSNKSYRGIRPSVWRPLCSGRPRWPSVYPRARHLFPPFYRRIRSFLRVQTIARAHAPRVSTDARQVLPTARLRLC